MRGKPINAVSARLELVRKELGIPTLRRFHEELVAGGDYSVSYEATRNYHYDRDPPLDYLLRVMDRFGIGIEWLTTGRGSMRDITEDPFADGSVYEEQNEQFAMLNGIKNEFPALPTLSWVSSMATFAPTMALAAYLDENPAMREGMGAVVRLAEDFGRRVGKSFAVPLQLLGVDPEYLPAHEMERYLLGMTFALGAIDFRQFFKAQDLQESQARQREEPEP